MVDILSDKECKQNLTELRHEVKVGNFESENMERKTTCESFNFLAQLWQFSMEHEIV